MLGVTGRGHGFGGAASNDIAAEAAFVPR